MELISAFGQPLLETGSDYLGLLLVVLLLVLLEDCLAFLLLFRRLPLLVKDKRVLPDFVVALHALPAEDGVVVRVILQLAGFFQDLGLLLFQLPQEATLTPVGHLLQAPLSRPSPLLSRLLPQVFDRKGP